MKIVVVAKLSASFLTTDSLPSTSQWRTSRSKRPSISHFFDHLSQEIDALRAMYQQNRTEFHDNVAEIRKLKAELKEAENECKELNTEIKNMYTMSVTETEAIERDVEGKGFSKDRIRALANENLSRFLELKEMFVAKEKKLKDNTEKLENSDKKLEDNLKNQDDNRTKFEETRRKLKDCAEKSDQFDEMTGKISHLSAQLVSNKSLAGTIIAYMARMALMDGTLSKDGLSAVLKEFIDGYSVAEM